MAVSPVMLAEPFFLKVLSIVNRTTASDSASLGDLSKRLKDDLKQMDAKVASGLAELSHGDWLTIKRMLVYWADEVLTTRVPEWQNYVLELDYYEDRNRAWKFYVEAEKNLPTAGPGCAELFYLAVVLGFRGDIISAFRHELGKDLPGGRADAAEARRAWAQTLQRQIRVEQVPPPAGEPMEGDAEPLASDSVHTTGIVLLIIYILCLFIISIWHLKNSGHAQPDGTTASETHRSATDKQSADPP